LAWAAACCLAKFGRLGSGGSHFSLLTHLRQLDFAGLLFAQFAFLNFTQAAGTGGCFLASLQFLFANDRGTIKHRCGRLFSHRFRHFLNHGFGNDFHFRLGLDDRFRHDFDHGLGNDFHFRRFRFDSLLVYFQLGFRHVLADITLDQDALLAHLDLDGTGAAMRIGGLDFRRLLAGQGDLGLGLVAMRTAQIVQKPGLVLIGQRIAGPFLADASLAQLLEQGRDRHFEFNGKL